MYAALALHYPREVPAGTLKGMEASTMDTQLVTPCQPGDLTRPLQLLGPFRS